MLEKECIQYRGFRNVAENGNVIGFQLKVRSVYYRGLWLSQVKPATISVDGVLYQEEQISWIIKDVRYSQKELESIGDVHWDITVPATLFVEKKGGLESGFHDVVFQYSFSSSYMPPAMDGILAGGAHNRRMVLV